VANDGVRVMSVHDDQQRVSAFEHAFDVLVRSLSPKLQRGERFALSLAAEVSDFVRLNHALVRQAGSVTQGEVSLQLIDGARAVTVCFPLTLNARDDERGLEAALREARAAVGLVPDDPHLIVCDEVGDIRIVDDTAVDGAESLTERLLDTAHGLDLVGILARGPVVRAVATSSGRRGFFANTSFLLDWSVYAASGRALKQGLAGTTLDRAALVHKIDEARAILPILEEPAREISRGDMRAYLAPAALGEIFDLLAWGGFGKRAIATKTSPLTRLADGEQRLSPLVTIVEDIAAGAAPPFHAQGFACAPRTTLIDAGRFASPLVSPRSAREYHVPHTGHDASEAPIALQMEAGDVDDPLSALERGVWLSNLWYLNFSDRRAGRITGMTRYACMLVEDGKPVAPLAPMRFDDAIFRILGESLRGLSRSRETLLSTSTYERRAIESRVVPGAIVDGLRFTL
jgi:predicted Zn-dependent protease